MATFLTDQSFDEERALYNPQHTHLERCVFAGPADGEYPMREFCTVTAKNCTFSLRYLLWDGAGVRLDDCVLDEKAADPLWFNMVGALFGCTVTAPRAVRKCRKFEMKGCTVDSREFGWHCQDVSVRDSSLSSDYLFLGSTDLKLKNVKAKGSCAFQNTDCAMIENSELEGSELLWNSRDVTLVDSVIRGERIGWHSTRLKMVNCTIIGTQPFCYCEDLYLDNCRMVDTDLAFESSYVVAELLGTVESVRNPRFGRILADGFGAIIWDRPVRDRNCVVRVRGVDDLDEEDDPEEDEEIVYDKESSFLEDEDD